MMKRYAAASLMVLAIIILVLLLTYGNMALNQYEISPPCEILYDTKGEYHSYTNVVYKMSLAKRNTIVIGVPKKRKIAHSKIAIDISVIQGDTLILRREKISLGEENRVWWIDGTAMGYYQIGTYSYQLKSLETAGNREPVTIKIKWNNAPLDYQIWHCPTQTRFQSKHPEKYILYMNVADQGLN